MVAAASLPFPMRPPVPNPENLPKPADAAAAERLLEDLASAAAARPVLADPAGRALLMAVGGNSPFLSHTAVRAPAILASFWNEGPRASLDRILQATAAAADSDSQATLMRALRAERAAAALTIGLADVAETWGEPEVTAALSQFADAAISATVRFLLHQAANDGRIEARPAEESGLMVFGMGKLGAGELNYSSDVDLIVFWDGDRVRPLGEYTAEDTFVRMTRNLVRILSDRTEDGYVFRTDLRLRPDPGATPVAMSMAAAEAYYESVGQNWERAAWIKGRGVAGDPVAAATFLKHLTPYMWRKHLDFAAIEDIHSLKRQIHAVKGHGEIAVRGHNLKLGAGGIREIEFFAQTLQLIAGGRDPSLRGRRTTEALTALAAAGRTTADAASDLTRSYWFLRRLEHRMQMIDDAQTHSLPGDDAGFRRAALFCGFADEASFEGAVRKELETVAKHSARLFEKSPQLSVGGSLVFTGVEDDPDTLKTLSSLGFHEPSKAAEIIRTWHHGRYGATRTERARELLTELMPHLLKAFGSTPNADYAFLRFDAFLSRLPAGVQLFSLLRSHTELLDLLAEIMGGAPRLAETLAQRPGILDAVLYPSFFRPLPARDVLRSELEALLAGANSYEDVLDLARTFANERKFQVGVQVMRGRADARRAGWMLTDLAEMLVQALLERTEAEFARQHGKVDGGSFGILGMGKFGAREMTAASDLDVIFLYDSPADAVSDGRSKLPAAAYYVRLSQRLITAISAPTARGRLYEVDARLRPSGIQGQLAVSVDGFLRYEREEAWTFERMALTRARGVAGTPALLARAQEGIRAILARPQDRDRLLLDVAGLRAKVTAQHGTRNPLDIKYVRGGTLDLEFLAQTLQLASAAVHPSVITGDTAAAFQAIGAAGILEPDLAGRLARAALFLRNVQSVLRATIEGDTATADTPEALLRGVAKAAGTVSTTQMKAELEKTEAWVYERFQEMIEVPAARVPPPASHAP